MYESNTTDTADAATVVAKTVRIVAENPTP